MIRHIVLFRPLASADIGQIAAVLADLAALKDLVPRFLDIVSGQSVSPEGLGQGYTYAFTVDFADAEARDAYLIHPAHQRAGACLLALTEGGADGLVVVDLGAPDHSDGIQRATPPPKA